MRADNSSLKTFLTAQKVRIFALQLTSEEPESPVLPISQSLQKEESECSARLFLQETEIIPEAMFDDLMFLLETNSLLPQLYNTCTFFHS